MAEPSPRAEWMGVLARAPEAALIPLWQATGLRPAFTWLRPPEIGSVMVRGRAGGTGAPFNLGELTVTRASLRIEPDIAGHATIQGRSPAKAEVAALVDALMQTEAAPRLRREVLAPLAEAEAARRRDRAARAAATRVEFFTLVRGDD